MMNLKTKIMKKKRKKKNLFIIRIASKCMIMKKVKR